MKRVTATGLLLCLLAGVAGGQELLTLEQAVSIGLENNYGIAVSRQAAQVARNNVTPGNAGMLPVVAVNAGVTTGVYNARVKVHTGSELDNPKAPADLVTAGAGLTWRLFDGMKMFITLDKLKKIEEESDLNARITMENTIAGIIGAYYDIVRQERMRQNLAEQVQISGQRLDLARMRFETGAGSELEMLKARVELNADQVRLSNQTTLYENAKTVLNDLLARDIGYPFAVTDTIPLPEPLSYDSLLASARFSNKDLLMAIHNRETSYLDLKTARANRYPTLDGFAGYNFNLSETQANFIQYNRYFGPSAGLTFNMKLFDGLNLKRQYDNAAISLNTYEIQLKQIRSRIEARLARAWNEYRTQLEMATLEQENLGLAVKNMNLARESFAAGAISSLQLREVQEDLLEARNSLVTARFMVKIKETELLLLSGQLLHQ